MAVSEQAAKQFQRAQNAARKADLAVMTSLLRNDATVQYSFKQHLVATGKWPKDGKIVKKKPVLPEATKDSPQEIPTQKSTEAQPADETTEHSPQKSETQSSAKLSNWNLATQIHRNFSTWGRVPPAQVRQILSALSPIACSGANLKSYMKKGMREVPRKSLLELLEYMVDKAPEEEVGEQRQLDQIIDKFESIYASLGCGADHLTHPVDWAKHGLYRLASAVCADSKRNFLVYGGRRWLVTLPGADIDDFHIMYNYSRGNAQIVSKKFTDMKPIRCIVVVNQGAGDVIEKGDAVGQGMALKRRRPRKSGAEEQVSAKCRHTVSTGFLDPAPHGPLQVSAPAEASASNTAEETGAASGDEDAASDDAEKLEPRSPIKT